MRATIKMIAERAGVSIGTVDRVLHDRPYVKAEVRQRVLAVMEELDYRPNHMASALATSGTVRRFAMVQPRWEGYVGREIAAGAARFREERRDYNLRVDVEEYAQGDTAACLALLERLAQEGADGIALCASDHPAIREKLEALHCQGIPAVTFNSDLAGARRLCFVGEDAHRAGRIAGEIAAKLSRPGQALLVVYAGPEYGGHKGRVDGFMERLEEVGFSRRDMRLAASHEDYDQTFAAVERALAEAPAPELIYMANQSVPACVEAIRRAGMEGRVRVLAHDGGPEMRSFLRAGQVDFSVDQNLVYQSYQALSVLLQAVLEHKLPEKEYYHPASPILNAETV